MLRAKEMCCERESWNRRKARVACSTLNLTGSRACRFRRHRTELMFFFLAFLKTSLAALLFKKKKKQKKIFLTVDGEEILEDIQSSGAV